MAYDGFALDPASVAAGVDQRTTLVVMNIPTKMTQERLKELVSGDDFSDKFDFLYLPIDWKTGGALGYAFINLKEAADVLPFYERFHGFLLPHSNSTKIWQVRYARMQGRAELDAHFASRSAHDKRIAPDFCVGATAHSPSADETSDTHQLYLSDSTGEPREPRRVRRARARALKEQEDLDAHASAGSSVG